MPDSIPMSASITRRRFLHQLTVFGGTALLAPAAAAAKTPVWVPIGSAGKFRVGQVTHVVLPDAFDGEELYVTADAHGEYKALSARCTHKGCIVNWDAHREQFQCPCHNGVFAKQGRNISGPPPCPLTALPVRVDPQGVVHVQVQAP